MSGNTDTGGELLKEKENTGGQKKLAGACVKLKNSRYGVALLVILGVYLAMKYVSPVVSPFIFAFLAAGLINPFVKKIHHKLKIKKSLVTGILLLFFCALFILLLWGLGGLIFQKGGEMAGQLTVYEKEFSLFLDDCCSRMEKSFGVDGVAIENFVLEQVNILTENFEVNVLPKVMDKSVGYVKTAASVLSFLVVMLIAVLLLVKDYDRLMTVLKENKDFKGVWEVCKKVIVYIKTFLKAQLIILCIISTICAVTLGLMGMKGGVAYGILTGFMDMLPFIGTGIMLLPLALFRLISGNYWQALLCACLYAACALTREFLEPRLIGDRVGIWPVGILFAVFAGIKLFGLSGIIKGPIGLVIICETCKYLWQEESGERDKQKEPMEVS